MLRTTEIKLKLEREHANSRFTIFSRTFSTIFYIFLPFSLVEYMLNKLFIFFSFIVVSLEGFHQKLLSNYCRDHQTISLNN